MFDENKAQRAIKFIENLKHTKGRWHGENFTLLPWQEEIVSTLFGTVKENGFRQYNTCYCEIPKKNGKSELAAAIALYLTCGDGEWAAEVYGCASDRQQASIVFDVAVDMVDQCPALKKRIKPIMSVKRLVYMPTNSYYQVLSAEAYTKHGLNVHGVIFDELHSQPNRELFDVMTKGSGDARTQPLYFLITTAGTDRNSICFEQHMKAEDILAGRKNDPTFYPVIYGLPDDADWSDEKNWYIANPSLGHTIAIEKVRNAFQSAKENPAEENIFRQLRLDQWVKQSTRWMPMDKWDECAFPVDPDELIGRECYGGLDLSSTSDLTAFVLVFPPRTEDEKYIILPYCWIPEDNMRLRIRRDHVPYDAWELTGHLQTTEGNVIHHGFIDTYVPETAYTGTTMADYAAETIYVDGNTVRTRIEERQTQENVQLSAAARKNREKALQMNLGYVLFLALAAVLSVAICVNYLRLQAQYTTVQKEATALETTYSELKLENDAVYNRIMAGVNLDEVKKEAMERLGMDYATEEQIVTYEASGGDYVRQYQDLPGK